MSSLSTLPVTLDGSDVALKRQEIRDYFHNSADLFELLFTMFRDDNVFYQQSEPTRHPMIFYFGHTATFFINKLILGGVITQRINPDFESMFAVGVDEMHWDDLNNEHYRWPDVAEVRAYRNDVRRLVDTLIDTLPLTLPITQDDPMWIILMGIEHERIHIETSSVLHRQLPIGDVHPIASLCRSDRYGDAPINSLVRVSGALVRLGKEKRHRLYGWDNEYGEETIHVNSFEAAKYLVSNGEFMAFVHEGGYDNAAYWDDEGKQFLRRSGAKHPTFWVPQHDGSFKYRTLTEEIAMPLNWPVDVNALEAMAFCRWKSDKEGASYLLPSEAQWHRMVEACALHESDDFNESRANVNLAHCASAMPVDTFAHGEFYDLVGNVWQWTRTPIHAFEGFEVHPIYDDFSVPTFDGRHNIMKGGSFISNGNEIMPHSRYAFRRHFYQHAGFRYVKEETLEEAEPYNIYESDALVSQYCDFHYGKSYFNVPNFAQRCAQLSAGYLSEKRRGRALDIGCATGRSSFELARYFDAVVGIDFSARFIQVGVSMKEEGVIRFKRAEEGDLTRNVSVTLQELNLEASASRVSFFQGDACNLKSHFKGYDLIMANNLIDRLYEPRRFLDAIHERLNHEGILVLTSPYTWSEAYTKKEFWLGGYVDDAGNAVHTLQQLELLLKPHFQLLETHDVEFVIRETPRKYQHTIAQMSIWKKY